MGTDVCVQPTLSREAVEQQLKESPAAKALRTHGADLDTSAAIVGTLGEGDVTTLLQELATKRFGGTETGWIRSSTVAHILSHYPKGASAELRDPTVVRATYKNAGYWHRKLLAWLSGQPDDIEVVPGDDSAPVAPDDPRAGRTAPHQHPQWLRAKSLTYLLLLHPLGAATRRWRGPRRRAQIQLAARRD